VFFVVRIRKKTQGQRVLLQFFLKYLCLFKSFIQVSYSLLQNENSFSNGAHILLTNYLGQRPIIIMNVIIHLSKLYVEILDGFSIF
jgi:hypothetical protein